MLEVQAARPYNPTRFSIHNLFASPGLTMTTDEGPADRPAGDTWERVGRVVERFEHAWENGERPDLGDYLPADGPDRRAVLVELAHVDLERRLKAGEPARVEDYLSRFPELAEDQAVIRDLIATEYRVRQGREPGLTPDEYRARFPRDAADLAARLQQAAVPGYSPEAVPRRANRGPGQGGTIPASADRNLLFGILALQADIIDAQQFVTACSEWASRKATPLADILAQRGGLTPEDRALVDQLLEKRLKKHRGDARASLAAVATPGVRSVLESVADEDVRNSLVDLPPPDRPPLPLTVHDESVPRHRYRLSRVHARGGIGQVWLAHDEDLGRDVAIKELRPDRQDNPSAKARFLEEAKITGQLDHPGIVPVYELVQPQDGPPCYAMRFVGGRTLADAVKDYHRRRQAGEAGPLDLRELLTAFVAICNAVGYAHSRGVLHRDLKPANVALGEFGEVLVIDWGLAKVVGKPGTRPASRR
jgi:hypothetical protein